MERSKKSTTPRTTPTEGTHGLVDLAPAEVEARMAEVAKHLDAIDGLLTDAEGLNAAQRKKTARLRGDGEQAALNGVLQFAALHSELFGSLAAVDEGTDPTKFETDLLMNRLANSQTIGKLVDRLAALESQVSSIALNAVALAKPTTLKAYDIAKAAVAGRVTHSALVFPAQDFYRAAAVSGAKTRSRNKAAAGAAKPAGTT